MSKAKFILKKLRSMNYGNYLRTVDRIHKESGKGRLWLLLDSAYCGFRYDAGFTDYLNTKMYNKSRAQRETIITSGVNDRYVIKYNDRAHLHFLMNKIDFDNRFSKYLNRDWMVVRGEEDRQAFMDFIDGKEEIILKTQPEGFGGEGVFKEPASPEVFDRYLPGTPFIAEEKIVQCKEMASLNPGSVNSLRVVTFLRKDGPVVLAAYVRIGQHGIVDNFCSGGMLTPVDLETGVIRYPAVDIDNIEYTTHPVTGTPIVGFTIPRFGEVLNLVREVAREIPEVRYVGWDVAIAEDRLCLIEGNEYPGHVFYNFPAHNPTGYGMRKKFEAVFDD